MDSERDDVRRFFRWNRAAWARFSRLCSKELREVLRDRRTILTLVLMPILAYPLLGVAFRKLLVAQLRDVNQIEYHIGFSSEVDAQVFAALVSRGSELVGPDLKNGRPVILRSHWQKDGLPAGTVSDWVRYGLVDVGVELESRDDEPPLPSGQPPVRLRLLRRDQSTLSDQAIAFIRERVRAVNQDHLVQALAQSGVSVALPAIVETKAFGTGPKSVIPLATLVPLILILMTVTGAVYPAIDLTAGERERHTLETLIAAPVSRFELLGSKYVAVLVVAVLTAVINLLTMLATIYTVGMESLLFGDRGLTLILAIQVFGLLVVFAGFFSAALLCLTSVARSFKEAQAYLIPLMLVSMAPGMASLTPGLELTPLLAVAPMINIVLLARDTFSSSVDPMLAGIAVASTIAYAVLALAVGARVFGTDAIIHGSSGTWREWMQRPEKPSERPSLGSAVFTLGVLFSAFVIVSSLPGRLTDLSVQTRMALNAAITILLFIGVPLVMTWHSRVAVESGFQLRRAGGLSWAAAVLLGVSMWPFAYQMEVAMLDIERLEELMKLTERLKLDLKSVPLASRLITLALVPAVAEEFFFRGFLLSALRPRLRPPVAIAVTGCVFGLFHIMVQDVLTFERFVPSAMMGFVLGWVCIRSNSVLPGILLHTLHNGSILVIADRQEWFMQLGVGMSQHENLPPSVLLIAGVLATVGIVCGVKSQPSEDADETAIGN